MKVFQGSFKTRILWVCWMHKSAVKWRQEFRRCAIARTLLAGTPTSKPSTGGRKDSVYGT